MISLLMADFLFEAQFLADDWPIERDSHRRVDPSTITLSHKRIDPYGWSSNRLPGEFQVKAFAEFGDAVDIHLQVVSRTENV